jgi:DNA-binding NarL/FixJ family response regulator
VVPPPRNGGVPLLTSPIPGGNLPRVIEVVLVDDHPAVRAGLHTLLRSEPGILPRAVAGSVAEAEEVIQRETPDVVLADYQLGDGDGLALCRRVKALPSAPAVLLYSAYARSELALAAVVSGVDALVCKSAPPEELFDAVRLVARGQRLMPHPAPDELAAASDVLEPDDLPVLGMLVEGTPPGEVAEVLRIGRPELDARVEAMVLRLGPRLEREPAGR